MSTPSATKPEFDFTSLTATKAEVWTREGGGAPAKPIPENILTALRTSKANDAPGQFTVPGKPFDSDGNVQGVAKDLQNLLRRAAAQLGIGCRVKVEAKGANQSVVKFHGTEKKAFDADKPRRPSRRKDETDPEYNARYQAYERAIAEWHRANRESNGS